jgi:hypothetical protein
MIKKFFAKFENGEIAEVSLIGNEIDINKITAQFIAEGLASLKGPAPKFAMVHWQMFENAFRTLNAQPVNGFMFDLNVSEGLLAIHKSTGGMTQMIEDAS